MGASAVLVFTIQEIEAVLATCLRQGLPSLRAFEEALPVLGNICWEGNERQTHKEQSWRWIPLWTLVCSGFTAAIQHCQKLS